MRPKPPSLAELGDEWFESEQPYSTGCAIELRRIRRRTAARPFLVFFLAALATTAITYRVATKTPVLEAEIIIALSEEALASDRPNHLPAVELREYISSVLMSDHRLLAIIEKWNLHPLRRRLGPEYALTELRGQMEVAVWRNTFAYYDLDDQNARKSARIGITVLDTDPDKAYGIAHELATAVVDAHRAEQLAVNKALAAEVTLMREHTEAELEHVALEISFRQAALLRAKSEGKHGLASALLVDLTALAQREKLAEEQLTTIVQSRDAIALEIANAGLDVSMHIVEERRPNRPERGGFSLLIVIVVVGTCSLLGMALVVGAFDPRIHDLEDIKRLGIPVLGHVP
jgi:capsular polysaccharide biosynthesis protein